MAVVGNAYVNIRAIADNFHRDLNQKLSKASKDAGDIGAKVGAQFSEGMQKELAKGKVNLPDLDFSQYERDAVRFGNAWSRASHQAGTAIDNAGTALQRFGERAKPNMFETFGMGNISVLMKRFFYMILWGTPIVGALVGAIAALASGLFALGSALAPAVNTLAVLPGLLTAIVTPAIAGMLAFQGIGDAYSAGVEALSGGEEEIKKFQEALDKLQPGARGFTEALLENRDAFVAVKNAAGSQIFGPLTNALNTIVGNGFLDLLSDGLAKAGGALGGVAEKVASLTSEPFFQDSFRGVMDSNVTVMGSLGDTLRNLVELFFTVANAARPVTEEFAAWIATVTGNWASSASGNFTNLRDSIERGAEVVKQLGRVFGNLWEGIKNVGAAAKPAGDQLLAAFERATEKFAELTGDEENQKKLTDFFYEVSINVRALGDLFNTLVLEFGKLGDNKAIREMARIITNDVIPALSNLLETGLERVGPQLTEVFEKLVEIFARLTDSGGLNAFLDVIGLVADALIKLTNIPGFSTFLGVFAAFVGTMKAASFVTQATGLAQLSRGLGNFIAGARGLESASGFMGKFGASVAKVGPAFKTAGTAIATNVASGLETMQIKSMYAWDGIKAAGTKAADGFKSIGTKIADSVSSGLSAASSKMSTAWAGIKTGATNAGKAVQTGFSSAATVIGRAATAVGTFTKNMALSVAASVRAGTAAAVTAGKTLLVAAAEKAVAAARKIGAAAQWLLNAAMRANPIGIIITLVSALVAAIVWLWNNNEGFRNFIIAAWEGIQKVFKTVIDAIVTFVTWLWERIQYYWNLIVAVVKFALETYWNIVMTVFNAVRDFIMTVWNGIVTAIQNAWNWIITVVSTAVNTVWTWISTIFTNVWNFIVTIWNNILTAIQNAWNWIVAVVQTALSFYWNLITTAFNNIRNFISSVWTGIQTFFSTIWNNIVTVVSTAVNNVRNFISNTFNNIRSTISSILSGVLSTVAGIWNNIYSTISGIVNNIWSNVTGIFGAIAGAIGSAFSGIAGSVQSAFSSVTGIIKGAINGVIGLVNGAIRSINGISVDIPDWVPGVGGQTWGANIPTIPRLAKGGTVGATPGGTLALIAEAGKAERVEPLDANGLSAGDRAVIQAIRSGEAGKTIQIVINPPPETDVFTLAKLVSREIEWQG